MMKHEFEERVGHSVIDEDYEKIEIVYDFYPSNEPSTKDDIAFLYRNFGMRLIDDMLPRAQKVAELDLQIDKAKSELSKL